MPLVRRVGLNVIVPAIVPDTNAYANYHLLKPSRPVARVFRLRQPTVPHANFAA